MVYRAGAKARRAEKGCSSQNRRKNPEQLCDLVKGAVGSTAAGLERWVRERGVSFESFVSIAGTGSIEKKYTETGKP